MLGLVKSFQSPAFTSALRRVLSLPDGADAKKIHEVLGPEGRRRRLHGLINLGKPRPPGIPSRGYT
jgi:hypothetical protein